jgi:ribosomal protein S18 acetylase RimI-like enzyme
MNIRILLLSCAFLGTFIQTSFAAAAAPAVSASPEIRGHIESYNPERDRDFIHSLYEEYWNLLEGEGSSYRNGVVDYYLNIDKQRAAMKEKGIDESLISAQHGETKVFIDYKSGIPVGFIITTWTITPESPCVGGMISKLAITKEYQRKGIGSALLTAAIDLMINKASSAGANFLSIMIGVAEINANAIRLYQQHDFTVFCTPGTTEPMITNGSIMMQRMIAISTNDLLRR